MKEVNDLLNRLRNAGVRITADNGKLSIIAPRGTITEETRAQLARHKAQVLVILQAMGGVHEGSAGEPTGTPNDSGNQPPETSGGDLAGEVMDDSDLSEQPLTAGEAQVGWTTADVDSDLVEQKVKPTLKGQSKDDAIANAARRTIGGLLAVAYRRHLSAGWAGLDQVQDFGDAPLANSCKQSGHGDVA